MPARDIFHDVVRNALIADGWTITDDPYTIEFGGSDLYVDLAAEKILAAYKGTRKIAVEIKSFVGPSQITDFHLAIGQFINYRTAMQVTEPDRVLFLAVPLDAYDSFFQTPLAQTVVAVEHVRLIVYSVKRGEITVWKE